MQPINYDALEPYCLRCRSHVDESARTCWRCGTEFSGSGRFQRVHGPLPSALFAELHGSEQS